MANLREIKKRIESVKSTKQITRTMEMVSSAKIRRASERVQAATPYSNAMEEMLDRLTGGNAPAEHPLLEVHDGLKGALIVAITSDRGLAGAFNTSVLRRCDQMVANLKRAGADVHMIACGKKAIAYFAYRGYETLRDYRDLSADPTIDEAREIAAISAQMYTEGDVDAVYMIYNHARNAADQDLLVMELLPIRPGEDMSIALRNTEAREDFEKYEGESEEDRAEARKTKAAFEYEPDTAEVLSALLPTYLETQVYHGLLDSAAAEQGARRKAMKAATDNATEMIDTLTRVYNGVRQSAITTEITEIVSGAAAAEE